MITLQFNSVRKILVLVAGCLIVHGAAFGQPDHPFGRGGGRWHISESQTVNIGGASIQVDFAEGELDLGRPAVLDWVRNAARAVTTYYGHFPVKTVRVVIIPEAGQDGVFHGTTWGDRGGFQGFTRISVGQKTTTQQLADDWMMTHELTHMAFPDLPDENHWMEEGIATYVEPIARVQAGELDAKRIWPDMMDGMPKGEPKAGDEGLDRTHTWGRTYWGGALFCLVADVEIRKETRNRKGLQDALRAIADYGGTIDQDWTLVRALEIGDRATGTHVLTTMYHQWGTNPVDVDLPNLWKSLGVRTVGETVEFDSTAPLARVRSAIFSR
ncbi:MAG TPA: hypothetical protein VHN81_12525 [Edaphobacter sp.]|nr:hypothetical protein [Edaphobacter sp.]